jgi:hypothetical protein
MKRISPLLSVTVIGSWLLMTTHGSSAADRVEVDLTRWTAPDVASLGQDAFAELAK